MMTSNPQDPQIYPVWPAMWNGLRCRCPKCGKGRLYRGYIEITGRCPVCGEDLSPYRVELLVPFVVIIVVAYVLIFLMVELRLHTPLSPIADLAILLPLGIIVPALVLRSVKGAILGLLWARHIDQGPDE